MKQYDKYHRSIIPQKCLNPISLDEELSNLGDIDMDYINIHTNNFSTCFERNELLRLAYERDTRTDEKRFMTYVHEGETAVTHNAYDPVTGEYYELKSGGEPYIKLFLANGSYGWFKLLYPEKMDIQLYDAIDVGRHASPYIDKNIKNIYFKERKPENPEDMTWYQKLLVPPASEENVIGENGQTLDRIFDPIPRKQYLEEIVTSYNIENEYDTDIKLNIFYAEDNQHKARTVNAHTLFYVLNDRNNKYIRFSLDPNINEFYVQFYNFYINFVQLRKLYEDKTTDFYLILEKENEDIYGLIDNTKLQQNIYHVRSQPPQEEKGNTEQPQTDMDVDAKQVEEEADTVMEPEGEKQEQESPLGLDDMRARRIQRFEHVNTVLGKRNNTFQDQYIDTVKRMKEEETEII